MEVASESVTGFHLTNYYTRSNEKPCSLMWNACQIFAHHAVTQTPSETKYLIFECLILTNHFSLGAADVLLMVFCMGERRAPTLNSDMQNWNNCLWNLWTWKLVCPSPLLISLTTWHVCKPWSEVQDDVCVWCVRLFIQEVATSSEWQQNQFHSCN